MKRLGLLALAMLQLACAPDFGGLNIELVAGSVEAQVDADAVIVPEGSVIAFEATPIPLQERRSEILLVSRVGENRTHGLNGGPTGILFQGEGR